MILLDSVWERLLVINQFMTDDPCVHECRRCGTSYDIEPEECVRCGGGSIASYHPSVLE